jgi:hypothetical protein
MVVIKANEVVMTIGSVPWISRERAKEQGPFTMHGV